MAAIKCILFIFSALYGTVLSFGKGEANPPIMMTFFEVFQLVSTLITIAEMVFHFHLGYVDPVSSRIVMEPYRVYNHYLKTKTLFPLDVISLLPVWISARWLYKIHEPYKTLFNPGAVLSHRMLRVVPLVTILIQLIRSTALFRRPPQAQPFNTAILSAKYSLKVILIVFSVFCIFALLWICAGCPQSVDVMNCESHGWIHVAMLNTPAIMGDETDVVMTSMNFVVSVASGAGFGDVTAHNNFELGAVVFMIVVFTFVNCQLQAQVLTAVYSQVLRQV